MKIYEVSERTTKLLTNIIKVWEQSDVYKRQDRSTGID